MNSINTSNKLNNFLSKIRERNIKIQKEYTPRKKDEKYINFEFKIKHFLLFDKSGLLLINSSIAEYSKLTSKFIDKIKLLVMKIISSDMKYFEIFFKHYKIFISKKNFIYVIILSNKYNSCLVRLYMFFFNIMLINLLGENILNQTYVDLLRISKIIEVYYIPPLSIKFSNIIRYILSKKEANSSKYLYKFKNLFIYYIDNNGYIRSLFDYRKIIHSKEVKYKYNIRNNNVILNFVTSLILEPIYNNNYINQSEVYSHSLELFSTFPRWLLIGKYLKIFDGINFIQLYSANKLTKMTVDYQEFQIKEQQHMDDYYKITSKHSNKFLKLIEFFLYNYFETLTDIMNKYCNPKNELLYLDMDLLIVTNEVLSLKLIEDSLVNIVYKKLQKGKASVLLEEKNENSNSRSNSISSEKSEKKDDNKNNGYNSISGKGDNNMNNESESKNGSSSDLSITSVSKTFLQLETSDVLRELKRKSIQLSSFDSNTVFDNKSELTELWNISCIKNPNQNNNNYDLRSLFSNIPGDKKLSGFDTLSLFEKQQDKQHMSRRPTDKQINIFRGHRNSIGPTFNIIVNNNNNNNNNEINDRKVSMASFKNKRYSSLLYYKRNTTQSPKKVSIIKNNRNNAKRRTSLSINRASNLFKRSNSSTMSGLYLNQFYSLINNNPRFFKTKYQIIKEIQDKIKQTSTKRSNSLIIENKYDKKEKKENNNINIINQINSPIIDEEQEVKNDLINEYYEDKSSNNFLQNNNNNIFMKLNEK